MRIGMDVTPCLSGVTGVARHTATLLSELRVRGIDVRPFAVGRGSGHLPAGTRHLRIPLRALQTAWAHGLPPRAEQIAGDVDLFHSVDLVMPPTRLPLVATIHDVAALDRPDLHPPRAAEQLRQRLAGLERATLILANSRSTAEALARHGISSERVRVVHHAPPPVAPPAARAPVEPPFLLAVGELTARKDYPTLLRALATQKARHLRLVVVGPTGFGGAHVVQLAAALGLDGRVQFLGRISDEQLARLYLDASALCFPSLIEGFGLPLVEAMRAFLPVVASDIPVVREVAGSAALYVSTGDPEGWAEAIVRITTDRGLASTLAEAGLKRASRFSWAQTTGETIEAYREALSCV